MIPIKTMASGWPYKYRMPHFEVVRYKKLGSFCLVLGCLQRPEATTNIVISTEVNDEKFADAFANSRRKC
jgi:hypothetical protein